MCPAVGVLGAWDGLAGKGLVGPVAGKGWGQEVLTNGGITNTHFTDKGT